jgi:hypothetical protein
MAVLWARSAIEIRGRGVGEVCGVRAGEGGKNVI